MLMKVYFNRSKALKALMLFFIHHSNPNYNYAWLCKLGAGICFVKLLNHRRTMHYGDVCKFCAFPASDIFELLSNIQNSISIYVKIIYYVVWNNFLVFVKFSNAIRTVIYDVLLCENDKSLNHVHVSGMHT